MASRRKFHEAPPPDAKLERLGASRYDPRRQDSRGGATYTVSFALDEWTDRQIAKMAALRGSSRSQVIRELVAAQVLRR